MTEGDVLPKAEFAFPGELRDRLVRAILDGEKTATVALLLEYELDPDAALPLVGARSVVVDSDDRPVAIIETTDVRVLRVADVDVQFARYEGEGFDSVAEWREAHVAFWESDQFRESVGRPTLRVDNHTQLVAERFRLVERLT